VLCDVIDDDDLSYINEVCVCVCVCVCAGVSVNKLAVIRVLACEEVFVHT
jgi:hypothetical protein